jgi:hypothetical protein
MLAELRLVVAAKEARLLVRHGDDVVEDEVWKYSAPLAREEARALVTTAFDDLYDMMQHVVHGDD